MIRLKGYGRVCAAGVLLLPFAGAARSETRVVDPSDAKSYRTIASAVSGILTAGTEVIIKAGVYREDVQIRGVGTPANPVTIRAADGDEGKVIIKGSDVVTQWEKDDVNMIPGGTVFKTSVRYEMVTSKPSPKASEFSKRVDLVFVNGRMLQQVLSLDKLAVNTFFVADVAGPRDLRIGLPDEVRPESSTIEVATRQAGLHLEWANYPTQPSEYVHIKGLSVMHVASACDASPPKKSGAIWLNGRNNVLEKCRVEWNNYAGIRMGGESNRIVDCICRYNGNTGMDGGPKNCVFINNTTSYNSWRFGGPDWHAGGMKWAGNHKQIRGNVFRNCVSSHNNGPGIWFDFTAGDTVIDSCVFDDNLGAGLNLEAIYPDYGGFLVTNCVMSNTRCRNGTAPADPEDGVGIQLYEASSNRICRNTIVGNAAHGIVLAGGRRKGNGAVNSGNMISGNVIALNGRGDTNEAHYAVILHTWEGSGEFDATHVLDHNVYWQGSPGARVIRWHIKDAGRKTGGGLSLAEFQALVGQDRNSREADPLFVDDRAGDYRLREGSPCAGTGAAPTR